MAVWERVNIISNGVACAAQAPLIISASRATDIPAFYSEWLLRRLEEGFVRWDNPFNGKPSLVSFARARLFVFWTKNPRPLMARLDAFDRRGLNYYFQFTLNDYEAEGLEPGVPPLDERVAAFAELSERIGPERVIWRFDPLLLTDTIDVETLLRKLEKIARRLQGFTRRLVISFADIQGYANVARNLAGTAVRAREFSDASMRALAAGLMERNREWGFQVGTCAENIDLSDYGIEHTRCVDDRLIARVFAHDPLLAAFVAAPRLKDKGQRKACGCIPSKDIGAYGTCPHLCAYCYANACAEAVMRNYRAHLEHPRGAGICGA